MEILSPAERRRSGAFMRINHSGEVCAQALYLGQALVARDLSIARHLHQAAAEEKAHLGWCAQRIAELGDRKSFLNPLWAIGSFGIGVLAGISGDKISLSFLAETEEQVSRHLEKHLAEISPQDQKTKAILLQMQEDEKKHATHALDLGGMSLPAPVRSLMRLCSKVMTTAARFI